MSNSKSQNTTKRNYEPMTVERMREYLFGGPQVPFWNYDPNQLTVGVEVEYFIAHIHPDQSYTLATKAEYLRVMDHLVKQYGYKDHKLTDQPGRVSRDTEFGFIAIKPDFAWHILEISFPPRKDMQVLRTLIENVFREVDRALAEEGLERLDISSLPDVPEKIELVELDRLAAFSDSISERQSDSRFFVPNFPALVVATHIHLNAFNESKFKLFHQLFAVEKQYFALFDRSQAFRNSKPKSIRDEFMKVSMSDDYILKCIPPVVPSSIEKYVEIMNASAPTFPNDKFFPVRNVTYIRPTKYGTLEFRSSCSTKQVDEIIMIAIWRIVQLIFSERSRDPDSTAPTSIETILNSLDGRYSEYIQKIRSKIESHRLSAGRQHE
jgi:hypothetical protein